MEKKSILSGSATEDDAYESMRSERRDSMFLMAIVRRPGAIGTTVKVRNLSPGGLMAESPAGFSRGELVEAEIRGIGAIKGRVAWSAGGRIGVQFDRAVDPRLARKPLSGGPQPPLTKPSLGMRRPAAKQS